MRWMKVAFLVNGGVSRKGIIILNMVKSMVKKTYRGMIFIIFLSIMMISTVLLLTFLADPAAMLDHIKVVFGITK